MAITIPTDFKVYNAYVQTGFIEGIAENIAGFGAGSNGGINVTVEGLIGDYKQVAMFGKLAEDEIINDRDKNSVTAVTPSSLDSIEDIIPYLPSRYGPYETTRSAFLDIGKSPEEFSTLLGRELASYVTKDMLNTGLGTAMAAVNGNAAMTIGHGSVGAAALDYAKLIDLMALYGDQLDSIACFAMRSKDYYALMKGNITAATIDSVAGQTFMHGTTATMGKPVWVTDLSALSAGHGAAAADSGAVIALTKNAITVIQDSDFYVENQTALLKENITIQWQGEGQYGVDLKGYAYDKTKAVTRASLLTTANWTKIVTSDKNTLGGVLFTTK